MPVKNKSIAVVAEKPRKLPEAAGQPHRQTASRPPTGDMLREIRARGDKLSSEIEELLVRLG